MCNVLTTACIKYNRIILHLSYFLKEEALNDIGHRYYTEFPIGEPIYLSYYRPPELKIQQNNSNTCRTFWTKVSEWISLLYRIFDNGTNVAIILSTASINTVTLFYKSGRNTEFSAVEPICHIIDRLEVLMIAKKSDVP